MRAREYQTSENGIRFITEWEGEILHVYDDGYGYLTAGVGHLLSSAEKKQFKKGDKITRQQSREWLQADLKQAESAVRSSVTVPITQNQFDALVSFAFNVGVGGFRRSSVLRNLNARHFQKAADALLAWNKAGGQVSRGLVRRREAERKLFLTPDAPSSKSAAPATPDSSKDKGGEIPVTTPQDTATQPVPPPQTLIPVPTPVVEVEQVKPETEDPIDKTLNKWSSRFMAVPAFLLSALGAFWGWLTSAPVNLIITLVVVSGLIAAIYVVARMVKESKAEARRDRLQAEREQRAHEVQMATLRAASDPNLQAVRVVPMPIANSDAAPEHKSL